MQNFLEDMEAAISGAPSQTSEKPAEKPKTANLFTEMPTKLNEGVAAVDQKSANAMAVLDAVQQELSQIGEVRQEQALSTQRLVTGIVQEDRAATEGLLQEAKPLFAKRAAINARQAELRDMNPFSRAIKGLFNRNYNEGYLRQEEAAVMEDLQTIGQEFQTLSVLRDRILTGFAKEDAAVNDTLNVRENTASQAFQLAGQQLAVARADLSDTLTEIEGQASLTRAQLLMKDKTLSEMGQAEINAALGAIGGNGKVIVNGVELTKPELEGRGRQLLGQALAIKSQQLGLEAQSLQLNQMKEGIMLSNMSFTDVQKALAAGGKFNGVQLDVAALQSRMGSLLEGAEIQAAGGALPFRARNAARVIQSGGQIVDMTIKRMQAVFGKNLPPQFNAFTHEFVAAMGEVKAGLSEVPRGTPQAQMAAIQAGERTAALLKQLDQQIEGIVTKASKDTDIQYTMRAWLTGQQLSPDQAARGLVAFAKSGSLPGQVRPGGVAAQSIAAARTALANLEKKEEYVNANAKQKERMELEAVAGAATSQWARAFTQQMIDNAPALAKEMGDKFGAVSPEVFLTAKQAGDQLGFQRLGAELGLTPQQVQQMFSPNGGKIWESASAKAAERGIPDLKAAQTQLVSLQTAAWLQTMDNMHPGASQAFAAFMNRPDVQARLGNFAQSLGGTGFAESLVDGASGGAINGRLATTATFLKSQADANLRQRLLTDANVYSVYGADPMKRVTALLAVNPNLTPEDEKLLMNAIRNQFGGKPTVMQSFLEQASAGSNPAEVQLTTDSRSEALYSQMANFVKNSRFQDPALERVRKIAAKDWDTNQRNADAVVDRLQRGEAIE